MQFVILVTLVAVAASAPQYQYQEPEPAPAPTYGAPSNRVAIEVAPPVAILRDERTDDGNGRFAVDFAAENGIVFSQYGSPDGPEGAVIKTGQYSYTAPDGSLIEVKYVADENGFQPQSDVLPVAPAFPHPIPQFVLDQIAFAEAEKAAAARQASASSSSGSYAPPPPAPSNIYGRPQ